MKTKYYKCGPYSYKAYYKTVGQGYEVGVYFDGKYVFVGNFIHTKEANAWWKTMNTYMKKFFAKYDYTHMPSKTWYAKFFANHMYANYYTYLDKLFYKYNKTYHKAFDGYEKTYKKYEKEDYYKVA